MACALVACASRPVPKNVADSIDGRVGYEDPAFFRRLFKRTTGLAPGAYRKRFQIPEFARS